MDETDRIKWREQTNQTMKISQIKRLYRTTGETAMEQTMQTDFWEESNTPKQTMRNDKRGVEQTNGNTKKEWNKQKNKMNETDGKDEQNRRIKHPRGIK